VGNTRSVYPRFVHMARRALAGRAATCPLILSAEPVNHNHIMVTLPYFVEDWMQ
jgi:hypothetical protein